jgi:hypothetical protein
MITTDEQVDQARDALVQLERAVRALRVRVAGENPSLFNAMAEDYRANILRIRGEIDEYLGLEAAGEAAAPLWMVLEGEAISRRDISSRLLSEWLDRFRKSLYGMTSYIETGLLRAGGRPDAARLFATDPHVVAVSPGSIKVGLRMPRIEEQIDWTHGEDASSPAVYRALEQLLAVAGWAASGATAPPAVVAETRDELSVAARFAARLAPTKKATVRSVTFRGALVSGTEPLRLTAESRDRLDGLVKLLSHVSEESITGQIREIDLDQRRIILRERGPGMPDVKCILPEQLVSVAELLLDRQVTVRGLISSATPDTMTVHSVESV